MNQSKPSAKAMIALAYGLDERQIDDEQVIHELVNLRRKEKKGNLDSVQETLFNSLALAGIVKWTNPVYLTGPRR